MNSELISLLSFTGMFGLALWGILGKPQKRLYLLILIPIFLIGLYDIHRKFLDSQNDKKELKSTIHFDGDTTRTALIKSRDTVISEIKKRGSTTTTEFNNSKASGSIFGGNNNKVTNN